MVKNPLADEGDAGLILGLGRSPGEVNGKPLQYSCPGNPRWAAVHTVAKELTRLSDQNSNNPQMKFSKGHLYVSSCLIQKPGNHTGPSHYSTVCIQSILYILSPNSIYTCPLHCYHPTPRHYYFWPGWRQLPPRIPPAQSCAFIIHSFHSSQGFLTITSLLSLELASGFKILLG